MRRVVAGLSIVAGVMLLSFTFAEHVYSRSRDAATIADHYRPLMSVEGLADLRNGFESLKAAGAELAGKAQPQLQRDLAMNDQQFADYLAREMPNIKLFDDQAAGVVGLVEPVIATMERERADYHSSDQIPVGFLPLSSAPWLFVGIGVLLVGAGALALVRPTRIAMVMLLLVGLGIAIAPIAVGIPHKVDAAVRVTRVGRTGLAPATAQKAVGATALFDAMVDDVRTKMEPAYATQHGTSAADAPQLFAQQFPTLAAFAETWHDTTSAKSHDLSDSQAAMGPTFANADRIPLRPIPWMFILSGIAIAVSAGVALAPIRRDVPATAAVARLPV